MAEQLAAPVENRDARLQWIRSVGAILVVCLHSASELMYSIGYGSSEWWLVNAVNGLSRCAVPLFVMASGAVFLDRCDDFAGFYRKRVKRIAIYLKNLLESLYNGKPYYHLWYLYMLIGLYLVIPFIQRLWAALTDRQKLLFTVVCFALAAIAPFEGAFLPVESGSPFFLLYRFLPYVGYFVCGHYLKTLAERKRVMPAAYAMLFMAALAAVTVIGSYFAGSKQEPGRYFFHYLSVNVILFTLLLYYLMMKGLPACGRPPAFIRLVDRTSLAIYLIHPAVLILIGYLYKLWMPQGWLFALFILAKIAAALAASMALGWVMLKLPVLRRTV
jgi:surface polysaccharide O-acyltransferase-like enzyme